MLPQVGDGFLFHFTSAEALFLILNEMRLKLSAFSALNDLNETNISCKCSDWGLEEIKIQEYIIEHCKLISFSQNYYEDEDMPSSVQNGCNHPRMWAQYAQNNFGACVVINEYKFLKENEALLKNKFYKIDNVEYKRNVYSGQITTMPNPKAFVQQHYKHLFFNKHLDWNREHERRFFGIDVPDYLSILNSLEFVCLGNRFISDKEYMKKLTEIIISQDIKSDQKIMPYDFALQINQDGRCLPIQFGFGILDMVLTMKQYTDDYLYFLKESGYLLSEKPVMRYY